MSPGKHKPNRLGRYQEIHNTVIQKYLNAGNFVRSENLAFNNYGDGYITLEGQIECVNGIYIVVRKRIRILSGEGRSAIVARESYNYNVVIGKVGNLMRYDGPCSHRPEHHVHRYDVLAGDAVGTIAYLREDDEQPTLGDVIAETEAWYYSNLDAVLSATIDR
mgnify:CR=1 FL=1